MTKPHHESVERAFRFWSVDLSSPKSSVATHSGPSLLEQLNKLYLNGEDALNHVVRVNADPVYVLYVLIEHCFEDYVEFAQDIAGIQPWNFDGEDASDFEEGDFIEITESELKAVEGHAALYKKLGISRDEAEIQHLRFYFDAFDDPPPNADSPREKTIIKSPANAKLSEIEEFRREKGRPKSEEWYSVAMALLARHFNRSSGGRRKGYETIANLLNKFCRKTFNKKPLSRATVIKRIGKTLPKLNTYSMQFEEKFERIKKEIYKSKYCPY